MKEQYIFGMNRIKDMKEFVMMDGMCKNLNYLLRFQLTFTVMQKKNMDTQEYQQYYLRIKAQNELQSQMR